MLCCSFEFFKVSQVAGAGRDPEWEPNPRDLDSIHWPSQALWNAGEGGRGRGGGRGSPEAMDPAQVVYLPYSNQMNNLKMSEM